MTTEDFELPTTGEWLVVPLTGTQVIVQNAGITPVKIRLGAGSNSSGMILEPKETVATSETVYIRAVKLDKASYRVVITR